MSSCPLTNQCNRCNVKCELRGSFIHEADYICVEGIDIDSWQKGEPLVTILNNIGTIKKTGCELDCTEYLAVYCPNDDTIYYNIDRIQRFIQRMTKENAAIFTRDIKYKYNNVYYWINNWITRVTRDFIAKIAIQEATARAILRYLLAHERYHWAGGPSNKTPLHEEEALATAWGLYVSFNEEFYRLSEKVRTSSIMNVSVRPSKLFSLELIAFHIIELYTYLLTLSRLALIHLNLQNYSGFGSYIHPPHALEIPMIRVEDDDYIEIKAGLIHVDAQFDEINIQMYGTMKFLTFGQGTRQRSDPLREVWACCEKQVSALPNSQILTIEDTITLIEEKEEEEKKTAISGL